MGWPIAGKNAGVLRRWVRSPEENSDGKKGPRKGVSGLRLNGNAIGQSKKGQKAIDLRSG